VSPSLRHDHSEEALGLFVMTVCEELDLPCTGAGSTTFRRKDWKLGVEGDRTYYLANEPRIREKAARGEDIDLASGDPPPDLALEIELTHPAIEALAIWQAFGTPEVWVYRPRTLTLAFFLLAEDGEYRESARSRAFPFLSASEIVDWITRSVEEPMSRWNRRLRAWVNEVLVPRTKGVDA
jgi:Uma2 family endonuclease